MIEWWSRSELLDANLPGLGSNAAISRLAKRLDWASQPDLCRKRAGRGGTQEIHVSLLPEDAQIALQAKDAVNAPVDLETKREAARYELDRTLSAQQQAERDGRLAILAIIDRYKSRGGHSNGKAIDDICNAYNNGQLPVDEWVRDTLPTLSKRSVYRWQKARNEEDFETLSGTQKGQRAKTGLLEVANEGEVKTYILALIAKMPQLGAQTVRKSVIKKFGEELEIIDSVTGVVTNKKVPPLRTMQHVLKTWKETYSNEILRLTNPDAHKGSSRFVLAGGASANICRLNQLWEIDASPADVMLTNGRWNIYACTDVFSRLTIILVTQTPRAEAVGLLVRDAIRKWGLPEIIKTDNGSDFVAKQTKRLFAALNIEHEICPPFSPEKKPHVERAIGTYQRGLARLLPGFIGHNVSDRSVIENRKRFSERLGTKETDIFEVELTAAELQDYSTRWCEDVYAHQPHSGLNGVTPTERAASYSGTIQRIDDQALDVLLAPIASGDGLRQVTKSGIRVNGEHYLIGNILPGTTVFCRKDPSDLGKLWVYDEEGEVFLGHAVAPAIAGLDPVKTIKEVRRLQKAVEDETIQPIRREMRKIGPRDVVNAVLEQGEESKKVISFPKPEKQVTTPALDAAKETLKGDTAERSALSDDAKAILAQMRGETTETTTREKAENKPRPATILPAQVSPIKKENKFERYRRALQIAERIEAGQAVTERDATWLKGYQQGSEYKAVLRIHQDFGDAAIDR